MTTLLLILCAALLVGALMTWALYKVLYYWR